MSGYPPAYASMGFGWLQACVSVAHSDDLVIGDDCVDVPAAQSERKLVGIHLFEKVQVAVPIKVVQAHPTVVTFLAIAEQPLQLHRVDVPFLDTFLGVLSENHDATSQELSGHEVAAAVQPAQRFMRVDDGPRTFFTGHQVIARLRLSGIAHRFLSHPG